MKINLINSLRYSRFVPELEQKDRIVLFEESLKSNATKVIYRYYLKKYFEFIDERENKDSTEYEYAMLKKALEDCYRIHYQIANDTKKSPRARSIASEMFVVARAQLVKLAEKGPTFKPQLTR